MMTTVYEEPRRVLRHFWTWVQAVGLVYVIAIGMVLLGATVALTARGLIELLLWIAR